MVSKEQIGYELMLCLLEQGYIKDIHRKEVTLKNGFGNRLEIFILTLIVMTYPDELINGRIPLELPLKW